MSGQDTTLGAFGARALLIVNTASRCGFTPQYEGLESLWQSYGDQGLTVLGFPCNQFGKQEPGSAEEILAFCEARFGVSFPLFEKVQVNGPAAHPLFHALRKRAPGLLGSRIKWNFTKFLVDTRSGVVQRYSPTTKPHTLKADIERILGDQL
ncbi:glutathione peroxidase [Pseudomonas sp. Marseille-QA0892]